MLKGIETGIKSFRLLAQLRSGGAIGAYAVNGISPQFVADFNGDAYFVGGDASTLSGALVHSRADATPIATYTDSTGNLQTVATAGAARTENHIWDVEQGATVNPLGDELIALSDGQSAGNIVVDETAGTVTRAAGTTSETVTIGATPASSGLSNGDVVQVTFTVSDFVLASGTAGVGWSSSSCFAGLGFADRFVSGNGVYEKNLVIQNANAAFLFGFVDGSQGAISNISIKEINPWVKGYLHESEARTNLITYSGDFTDTSWVKGGDSEVSKDAIGPDGITSATTLSDNSEGDNNIVRITHSVTVSTTTAYTYSAFLKADQLGWAILWAENFTTPANGGAYFNLSSGSIGTVSSGFSAAIEDTGNGWYRCSITFTTDAADTSGTVEIYVADGDGDPFVDLDGTSSILIYGAQFEQGSTPSSYIPTAGSTVTRAADVMTIPIENIPYPTGASLAVSIAVEGYMTYAVDQTPRILYPFRWDLNTQNKIQVYYDTEAGVLDWYFLQEEADILDSVNTTSEPTPAGINVPFSIASRHGSTFINGAVDGTALTANTTPVAFPALSTTDMSLFPTGNFHITKFRMWGKANGDIGDTGIAEPSS